MVRLDVLTPLEQVLAEAPGDGGEHDVVDRAAGRRLDPLDVGELGPGPAPAAVRPERPVEHARRRSRPRRPTLASPYGAHGAGPAPGRRASARPHRAAAPRARTVSTGSRAMPATPDAVSPSREGGRPGATGATGDGCASGVAVEQHLHQLVAGEAVDHRVVRLGDQRPPAPGQPLDEPDLPERPVEVEALGQHAAEQRRAAARRHRGRGSRCAAGGSRAGSGGRRPRPGGRGRAASAAPAGGGGAGRRGTTATCAASSSYVGAGPSKTSSEPTCICCRSFSSWRKPASSELSRCTRHPRALTEVFACDGEVGDDRVLRRASRGWRRSSTPAPRAAGRDPPRGRSRTASAGSPRRRPGRRRC